ncbi:tail virion protein G7P-2 [Litchfieldella rifensis]|uniref:Tail virion protein G7P-2 n=1 Tax=Litchfieldella rifensis TaxID=762643 RepID=A0ABV7LL08_9GAMM
MDADQFDRLWLLIYCIGLVTCFGLGAIKGGQR